MDEQALEDWKREFANKTTEELRYRVSLGIDRTLSLQLMEWAFERERAEKDAKEAEQTRIAKESLQAAKLAAETSRDAAIASRKSAFWTMIAAVAAAIGATVPFLQAVGWLPKS